MGEYDAVWVFLIATVFVGTFIFLEARPGGSTLTKDITSTISRFFRKFSVKPQWAIQITYISSKISPNFTGIIYNPNCGESQIIVGGLLNFGYY